MLRERDRVYVSSLRNDLTLKLYLTIPLDILTLCSPCKALNLRKTFLIIKTNNSDKESSLGLNDKSYLQKHSFQRLRDDFGFHIVNFPWLGGDVPRLPSYGIYISRLVRFTMCCTSLLYSNSNNRQGASKLIRSFEYIKRLLLRRTPQGKNVWNIQL